MQITLSELKRDAEKYVTLAEKGDVYIVKNGKPVAKLTSAVMDKVAAAKALFGILPADTNLDKARSERL